MRRYWGREWVHSEKSPVSVLQKSSNDVLSLVDIRVRRVTNVGQSHRAFDTNTSRKSDFSSVDELKIIMYFSSIDMSLISVY